jgi:hypothetical protein
MKRWLCCKRTFPHNSLAVEILQSDSGIKSIIKCYILTKCIAIINVLTIKVKHFLHEILGLKAIQEVYREERDSYKLDLALNGEYIVRLFRSQSGKTF